MCFCYLIMLLRGAVIYAADRSPGKWLVFAVTIGRVCFQLPLCEMLLRALLPTLSLWVQEYLRLFAGKEAGWAGAYVRLLLPWELDLRWPRRRDPPWLPSLTQGQHGPAFVRSLHWEPICWVWESF